jgi:hypothetical protein
VKLVKRLSLLNPGFAPGAAPRTHSAEERPPRFAPRSNMTPQDHHNHAFLCLGFNAKARKLCAKSTLCTSSQLRIRTMAPTEKPVRGNGELIRRSVRHSSCAGSNNHDNYPEIRFRSARANPAPSTICTCEVSTCPDLTGS